MHAAPRVVQGSRSSQTAKFTIAHRLLRENGFDHVIRAESIFGGNFKIFFARNRKNNARLGIIAGKKVISSAVARNRAKRVIREVFRRHGIKQCKLDLVVMVRRADFRWCGAQVDNLKTLFSQVENRCAEL